MTEQFANLAQSNLSVTINNAVTSLAVASASAFPSSGNFRIIVDSEIMLVTAVSGTTFTVTRAIEATVAAPHNSGALVTHILTAGIMTAIIGSIPTETSQLTNNSGFITTAGAPVQSVFGRTGAVTAQPGDYSFSQISGTFSRTSVYVDNLYGYGDDQLYSEYYNNGRVRLGDLNGVYNQISFDINNSDQLFNFGLGSALLTLNVDALGNPCFTATSPGNQIDFTYNNTDPDNPVLNLVTTESFGQVGIGFYTGGTSLVGTFRADYTNSFTFNMIGEMTIATGGLIGLGQETQAYTFDGNGAIFNNLNGGVLYLNAAGSQIYLGDGAGYGASTYIQVNDALQQVDVNAANGFLFGATAQENWNNFGSQVWFESNATWGGSQQNNIFVLTTQDSPDTSAQQPYGLAFSIYPDTSGNPVPTLISTQFGISYLPLYLNTNALIVGGAFGAVSWNSNDVLQVYDAGQNIAFSVNASTDAVATRNNTLDNGSGVMTLAGGLHLRQGAAPAGDAPLYMTAGTNLTSLVNGAMEYDGTHLYFTTGGTRHTIV